MYFIKEKLLSRPNPSAHVRRRMLGILASWTEDSVVLVGQGIGNTSYQLLPGSLHIRGEFPAEVRSQNNHQHVAQELLSERQNDRHVE